MTPTHRRAGTLAAGFASLAALALGACSSPTPYAAPRAVPQAAVRTATSAPVQRVAVPAGAVHTAPPANALDPAALPWSQVGPGWTAVAYTTHPNTGTDATGVESVGPYTVALVSPAGRRWTVGTSVQALDLRDVAPDGSHVLAVRWSGGVSRVVELDTHSRTWRDVASADDGLAGLQYTRPSAQQIWLGAATLSGSWSLRRLDRAGRVTLQLEGADWLVPTQDGRLFATERSAGLIDVRDNATGAVVRTVSTPSGYSACHLDSTYRGDLLTARCDVAGTGAGTIDDVLLLDASTGRWSALTHVDVTAHDGVMGYAGAWPLPGGALVAGLVGCGAGPTGVLDAQGRVDHWLSWPGAEQSPSIVGVAGSTVYAAYATCASPTQQLVAQDVRTQRTTVLLRAPWLSAAAIR